MAVKVLVQVVQINVQTLVSHHVEQGAIIVGMVVILHVLVIVIQDVLLMQEGVVIANVVLCVRMLVLLLVHTVVVQVLTVKVDVMVVVMVIVIQKAVKISAEVVVALVH